jgi:hypothetical protein
MTLLARSSNSIRDGVGNGSGHGPVDGNLNGADDGSGDGIVDLAGDKLAMELKNWSAMDLATSF